MASAPMLVTLDQALSSKYELLEHVGHGSFGDVWKARRLADDMTVALKIPRDQEYGEEVLRREPDLMRAFDHPHIVHVYGCHTVGSVFVIEMEYVAGHNLAEMLDGVNRDNPLSYARIIQWTQQILEGLKTIHAAGVAHNDIKPHNVLIDAQGNAKLVDFGTSRKLEDVWVYTRQHGTEAYWAPEVAFENRRGFVSDVYSVGVMLYEMVTGQLPYRSPLELATGRLIKRPREVNANVPPALELVVLRALERNPADRYPSAAAMLADVTKLLAEFQAGGTSAQASRTRSSTVPRRMDSSSPLYYMEEAKRLLADDDWQGALQAAQKAAERSNDHPSYLRLLGAIQMHLGYVSNAIETYEKVLAGYRRDFPAAPEQQRDVLERLGDLYIRRQHYSKAVKAYEQLLAVSPAPVYARFRLAIACGLDADYYRAIGLLEDVRRQRPDAVVVYSKLGWAHMLDGNERQALSYYNQALVLDPNDLFSLFELGRYHWIMGQRTRARSYFERVRHGDLHGKYASQIVEILG